MTRKVEFGKLGSKPLVSFHSALTSSSNYVMPIVIALLRDVRWKIFSTNTATLKADQTIESIDAVLSRTSWKETSNMILPYNT
jgi:hypothetical protein